MTSARRAVYPYITTRTEHVERTVITRALIDGNRRSAEQFVLIKVLSHGQPILTITLNFNSIRFAIYNPIRGYKRAHAAPSGVPTAQLSELCGAGSSTPPALLNGSGAPGGAGATLLCRFLLMLGAGEVSP